SDAKIMPNSETSAQTEATQLSFAEVMRLVQEGKEVPGVKKLDIKPTNQSPTPSQMERRSKPWEISSLNSIIFLIKEKFQLDDTLLL
uniref:Peroxisomal membrane protein PEX14-like KPWE domain-containing protein n=1 Tax=Sparus aurata TaxID=8175 RepID=A0A671VJD3_SPAAU